MQPPSQIQARQSTTQPTAFTIASAADPAPVIALNPDPTWPQEVRDTLAQQPPASVVLYRKRPNGTIVSELLDLSKIAYTFAARQAESMLADNAAYQPIDLAAYAAAASSIAKTYPFNPKRKASLQSTATKLAKIVGDLARSKGGTWVAVPSPSLDKLWTYPVMAEFSPAQKQILYSMPTTPEVPFRQANAAVKVSPLTVLPKPIQVALKNPENQPCVCVKGHNNLWYVLLQNEPDKSTMLYRLECHQRKLTILLDALRRLFGSKDIRYARLTSTIWAVMGAGVAKCAQYAPQGNTQGVSEVYTYAEAVQYYGTPSDLLAVPAKYRNLKLGTVYINLRESSNLFDGSKATSTTSKLRREVNIIESQFDTFVHELTHLSVKDDGTKKKSHDKAFYDAWRVLGHLAYLCGAWTGPYAFASCIDDPTVYGNWWPFYDSDYWKCVVPMLKKYGPIE